jgi:hypothetical protein
MAELRESFFATPRRTVPDREEGARVREPTHLSEYRGRLNLHALIRVHCRDHADSPSFAASSAAHAVAEDESPPSKCPKQTPGPSHAHVLRAYAASRIREVIACQWSHLMLRELRSGEIISNDIHAFKRRHHCQEPAGEDQGHVTPHSLSERGRTARVNLRSRASR